MPGMVQDLFAIFMVGILAGGDETRRCMLIILGSLRQRVLSVIAHLRNDVEQLAIIQNTFYVACTFT